MPTSMPKPSRPPLPTDAAEDKTLELPVFSVPITLPPTLSMEAYCRFNAQMAEQFGHRYPSASERAANRGLIEFRL